MMPYMGRQRYCTECEEASKAARKRNRDYKAEYKKRLDTEDPKYRRFYRSKEWRMTSLQYVVDAGHRCEMDGGLKCEKTGFAPCDKCKKLGTDVHHKEPIQTPGGWNRRFDNDNLELLCVSCHNCRHGRDFATHKKQHEEA